MNNVVKRVAHGLLLSAAIGLMTTGPVAAQSAGNVADGRCLAAMSMTQDKASKADKASFDGGIMYFLGKMVGRGGMSSVGPAIEAGAAGLTEARAAQLASTCADEITRAGDAM